MRRNDPYLKGSTQGIIDYSDIMGPSALDSSDTDVECSEDLWELGECFKIKMEMMRLNPQRKKEDTPNSM